MIYKKIHKYYLYIKYFFKHKIFILLKICYFFRSPRLTAYLWVKFADILIPGDSKLNRSVLVFTNGGGDLDLLARPKNHINREQYLSIGKMTTDDMLKSFFGSKKFDYNYETLKKQKKTKYNKYLKFIEALVTYLNEKHNIIGFINFNHVYSCHREIISTAQTKKIPFVVVFKECFKNDNLWLDMTHIYKHLLTNSKVSKILVHNSDSKKALLDSGIVDKNKISVVGQARSDKLFLEKNIKKPIRKKILFFAISPNAGLPNINLELLPNRSVDEKNRKLFIELRKNHNDKILKSLINYVSKNSEFDLVVKGKQKFWFDFKNFKNKNIFFEAGQPNFDLLLSSSVAVGFNTTGLIEAVVANIPAISVELKEDKKYKHDYLNVIHQVDNIEFLWKKLDQILYDKIVQENKNKNYVIDKYLGNSDGKAGKRLWDELDRAWNQN